MQIRELNKPLATRRLTSSLLLLMVVILLKPFSNLFLAWGVRHIPQAFSVEPVLLLRALVDPLVALGIGMQVSWLLARMALLSVADLSFVLPVTAIGYVLSTLLGMFFLHERVGADRWVGVLFIVLGTICAGTSGPEASRRSGGVSLPRDETSIICNQNYPEEVLTCCARSSSETLRCNPVTTLSARERSSTRKR